ncbi:zinc finger C3HC4 type family protein [Musa troglodytarum]|uniref:Zinc finger C3HC4 type family protein n=1 Tax=Musa troglodytarum TaxID=320322 RepID=A0A9E7GYN8_9LILI|nr:zinc finger C3HC4 type family protein [Musa troglodytarum]
MQTSRESSDRNGSEASTSSRYRLRFPPLSATLERLGASLARPSHTDNDSSVRGQLRGRYSGRIDEPTTSASSGDGPSVGMVWPDSRDGRSTGSGSSDGDGDGVGSSSGNDAVATEAALSSSSMPASASSAGSMSTDGEFDDTADNLMNMLLQRSEVQDLARWMERVLPFSLLLSMVFIRQHFQDTMVRQVAMAAKCMVLMRYTSSGGGDHRMQGKMLTVVEHFLLLYRFWLPSPVWFRFFLNEDHGSSLSYLTAGLYLAFKLTLASEKVQLVFAALKALSRNEGDDGRPYATTEQVDESGDLCAICLDRMRAPIALHCDHAFCEDCITRW